MSHPWPNFNPNSNQKSNEDEENPPIEPVSSGNSNYQYNASSSNFDSVSTSNPASNLAFDPVSSSTNTLVDPTVNNAPQAAFGYAEALLDFNLPPDVDISDPILAADQESTPESPLPSGSGAGNNNFERIGSEAFPDFSSDIPLEPSQADEMVSSTSNSCAAKRQSHLDIAFSSFEQGVLPQANRSPAVDSSTTNKCNSSFIITAPNEVNSTTATSSSNSVLQAPNIPCSSARTTHTSAHNPTSSSTIASTSSVSGGGHPSDPTKFHVDRQLLDQVLEFGFEEYIATLAIERTRGVGLEEAINWIIDHSNQSDLEEEEQENQDSSNSMGATTSNLGASASSSNSTIANIIKAIQPRRTHKMIFVANMGLKMGVGKLAAQVGHATLGVYRVAQKTREGQEALNAWRNHGEVKIVVKGQNTEQLLDLFKQAKDAGLYSYLVQDAGYTQIPPGSRTVLGIFGYQESVDQITGSLKLL